MQRRKVLVHAVLSALVLLGLTGAAGAGKEVPFRGDLDGVVTVTPQTPPFVFVEIEGEGNATQLGNFTVEIPHVVNRDARTAVGEYEFVAANGDSLFAEFEGASTPTSTPGVLSIVETATITGGTGRFKCATGSFRVERLYDTVSGLTTGSFEGTISNGGTRKGRR
jgi:hypothetical protein